MARKTRSEEPVPPAGHPDIPGQVVVVFQGGGALGAYQVGVYEALHERGIAVDWVIGMSIGAINGALIAGNRPQHRMQRLEAFWHLIERSASLADLLSIWPLA